MCSEVDLAGAFRRLSTPSASLSRQFATACEALNLQRKHAGLCLEPTCPTHVTHLRSVRTKLLNYYHQLAAPPISTLPKARLGVTFLWRDTRRLSKFADRTGVLEIGNVAYNIAVATTAIAAESLKDQRPGSTNSAATLFEEAACAFAHVRALLTADASQLWRDPARANMELREASLFAMEEVNLAYAARCHYDALEEEGAAAETLAGAAHAAAVAFGRAAARMQRAVDAKGGLDSLFGEWFRATDVERSYYLSQVVPPCRGGGGSRSSIVRSGSICSIRSSSVLRSPLTSSCVLRQARLQAAEIAGRAARPAMQETLSPPPPTRTKWTRRVPHPVLIGHAASLTPYPRVRAASASPPTPLPAALPRPLTLHRPPGAAGASAPGAGAGRRGVRREQRGGRVGPNAQARAPGSAPPRDGRAGQGALPRGACVRAGGAAADRAG
jgi:hypothetical protein